MLHVGTALDNSGTTCGLSRMNGTPVLASKNFCTSFPQIIEEIVIITFRNNETGIGKNTSK